MLPGMTDPRPCAPRPDLRPQLRYAPGVDPTMTPEQHIGAQFDELIARELASSYHAYVAAAIERARGATSLLDLIAPTSLAGLPVRIDPRVPPGVAYLAPPGHLDTPPAGGGPLTPAEIAAQMAELRADYPPPRAVCRIESVPNDD